MSDLIDFNAHARANQPTTGITFRQPDGEEFIVVVHDKYPQMADVHVEGRRYVEVSVELFISMAAAQGIYPVDPNQPAVTEEETK